MVILGIDPTVFLGPVPDTEVHALMFSLDDRDPGLHVYVLRLGIERFDVDELKERHAVEPTLCLLKRAALIEIAWLVEQLPPDDGVRHARIAGDFNRPEVRAETGLGDERDGRLLAVGAVFFVGCDLAIRVPVIAQLVERQIVSRQHGLPVARVTDVKWNVLFERFEMIWRDLVEPLEDDRDDANGITFVDGERDIHGVMLIVELDVETRDPSVRIAAIRVIGFDPLQVGVETIAVEEIALLRPREPHVDERQLRILARRQRRPQKGGIDGVNPFEGQ